MTTSDAVDSPLEDLALFRTHLDRLDDALMAERSALQAHDVAALEQATQTKTEAIEALADPRFGAGLSARIARQDHLPRQECEQLHSACLTIAAQLKDSNLVNGKILNRSQNSIREIINILSGKRADGLYGDSGQPTPDSQNGDAIAKA